MSDLFSHAGYMLKRGRANKRWRQRYFVAFKQELFYYTDESMSVHRGTVNLRGASLFVSKVAALSTTTLPMHGRGGGAKASGTTTSTSAFSGFLRQFRRSSLEAELTNGRDTRVVECASEDAIPLYVLIRTTSGRELDVVTANGRELGMWLAVLELHSRSAPVRKPSLRNVSAENHSGLARKQSNVQFKEVIEEVCEFRKSDPPRRLSLTSLPVATSSESLGGNAAMEASGRSDVSPSPTARTDASTPLSSSTSLSADRDAESGSPTMRNTLGLVDATSSRLVDFLEHIEEASDAMERCRRVAMSIQNNVRLDEGITDAVALEGMRAILRKLVRGFREELVVALAASPDARSGGVSLAACHSSTDAMRELQCAAESFVMTEVADRAFDICRRVATSGETRLAAASGRIRSESGSRCGVREIHRSASLSSSVAIFNGIDSCATPRDKVLVLKATVADLMLRIVEEKRKGDTRGRSRGGRRDGGGEDDGGGGHVTRLSAVSDASAELLRRTSSDWVCSTDDLISLMLMVISSCSVRNIVAHVADLSSFYDVLGDIGGEDAYHVATFAVAVEYLLAQADDGDPT